jgi:hypothetical protein
MLEGGHTMINGSPDHRPVLDVEAIEPFVGIESSGLSRLDLPEAGDTWQHETALRAFCGEVSTSAGRAGRGPTGSSNHTQHIDPAAAVRRGWNHGRLTPDSGTARWIVTTILNNGPWRSFSAWRSEAGLGVDGHAAELQQGRIP